MSKVIDDIIAREESGLPCQQSLPMPCKRLMLEVEQVYQSYVQAETKARHEAVEALNFALSYISDVTDGESDGDSLLDHAKSVAAKYEAAQ